MTSDSIFQIQPVLTGPRVRLEPLGLAVFEDYWISMEDPEVQRLTGTHAEFTREQIASYLESRVDQHDRADWAAIRIADGTYLGEAVVSELDPDNGSASYRIALAGPQVFGQGYGSEITQLVVDHVFAATDLHRLSLEVFDFNPRAQRVYEKCGFQVEGRLRDAVLWDGERHDALVMSVLRTDRRS